MNGNACTTIDAIVEETPDSATAFPVTDLPAPLARLDRIAEVRRMLIEAQAEFMRWARRIEELRIFAVNDRLLGFRKRTAADNWPDSAPRMESVVR